MLFNIFINRKKDIDKLSNFFNSEKDRSCMVIIIGNSGIGKSEFIEYFLNKSISSCIFVNIQTCPSKQILSSGAYLRELCKELSTFAKENNLLVMSEFCNRLKSKKLTKKYEKKLIKLTRIKCVRFIQAVRCILKRSHKKLFSENDFLEHFENWEDGICFEYANYILSQRKFNVVIGNYNSIDSSSFEYFQNLKKSLTTTNWFLEYNNNSYVLSSHALTLYDVWKRTYSTLYLSLEGIPFEEIEKYIPKEHSFNNNLYRKEYEKNKSNIRVLLKYFHEECEELNRKHICSTSFDSMNDEVLFLIKIIEIHGYSLNIILAKDICEKFLSDKNLYTYNYLIEKLVKINFIKIDHQYIRLTNESEVYFFEKHKLIESLAYKYSYDFYETILFSTPSYEGISRQDLMMYLIKINLAVNPLKIIEYMTYLKESILSRSSSEEAHEMLRNITQRFFQIEGVREHVWWEIAHLCYEAGAFDLVLQIISTINVDNDFIERMPWSLLGALTLHCLGEEEKALLRIDNMLNRNMRNKDELAVRILKMIVCRCMRRMDDAQEEYRIIFGNRKWKKYIEYAYFLRNLEAIVPPQKCITLMKRSIYILEKNKEIEQANKSRISLSVQLSRIGKMEEALDILNKLEESEYLPLLDRHMILNNRSAIQMMQGYLEDVDKLLFSALKLSPTKFAENVIMLNICIYKAKIGDVISANKMLIKHLNSIEYSTDPRILCAYYDALYNFSIMLNKIHLCNDFLLKIEKNLAYIDFGLHAYWSNRLSSHKKELHNNSFLNCRNFHCPLLVFWSFPLKGYFKR